MNLEYALELAITNEELMRDFYKALGARERPNSPLGELWRKMTEEEKAHAKMLKKIRDELSKTALRAEIDFNDTPLLELAVQIDNFHKKLSAGKMDQDDIFDFVIDIETGEQNKIFLKLVEETSDSVSAKLYKSMSAPIDAHMELLFSAVDEYSEDPELHKKVQQLREWPQW